MSPSSAETSEPISEPISLAGPTENETVLNNALLKELKRQGSFESEAEDLKRLEILNLIQHIALEFIYNVCRLKNMTDLKAKEAGGAVFTFGSYHLGVYGPDSDIDILIVAPKPVNREDFFSQFSKLLKTYSQADDIVCIPEAFVPIIKTRISGIPVDFVFAMINKPTVDASIDLDDKDLLTSIDEVDMRAISAVRVANYILRLVPHIGVFRHALRAVKLWAQKRAIYANVMGFPGGVAWAILVAKICQYYPNAICATILYHFFRIYSTWNWPKPVLLAPIEEGPLQNRVWNPTLSPQDRGHKMPVITPAYPNMCSTHNVTPSTQKIVLEELKRGYLITQAILSYSLPWSELFEKHNFFHKYKYYLRIAICSTGTPSDQLRWVGYVISRIRGLILKLETLNTITVAHPFIKTFDNILYASTPQTALQIAKGDFRSALFCQKADFQDPAGVQILSSAVVSLPVNLNTNFPEQIDQHNQNNLNDLSNKYDSNNQQYQINAISANSSIASSRNSTSSQYNDNIHSYSINDLNRLHISYGANGNKNEHENRIRIGNGNDNENGITRDTQMVTQVLDLTNSYKIFTSMLYIGLDLHLEESVKKLDLQWPCKEFNESCRSWSEFQENKFHISVRNLKGYELPNEVFSPGEVRPVHHKKRRRKNTKSHQQGTIRQENNLNTSSSIVPNSINTSTLKNTKEINTPLVVPFVDETTASVGER